MKIVSRYTKNVLLSSVALFALCGCGNSDQSFSSSDETVKMDRSVDSIANITASIDDDFIQFKLKGGFHRGSHYQIFINSDGADSTGYSRGTIKGADYLIEDGHLYQYPSNTRGWHWGKSIKSDIKTEFGNRQIKVRIPLDSIQIDDYIIKYATKIFSSDWKHVSKSVLSGALDTLLEQKQANDSDLTSAVYHQTTKALRNPLKGFMGWNKDKTNTPYLSMYKSLVPWNEIENQESDGVEKVIEYSNRVLFQGRYKGKDGVKVEESNIKVNPEVLIKKGRSSSFAPSDMDIAEHDNQTDEFARRVRKLVKKLGKAWDNDPRIGFVYMGIVGTWGEQWSVIMSPKVQKALGESFQEAFKHKKVMVRLPHYFHEKYLKSHNNSFRGVTYNHYFNHFGMYWDAFAQDGIDGNRGENRGYLDTINVLRQIEIWKEQPILGEVAFNMDYSKLHTNKTDQNPIDATMSDPESIEYLNDYIHITHATALSWIDRYNHDDPDEAKGANVLQKAMGYRFFIPKASYTPKIGEDRKLHLEFSVKNLGSAPFYYRWPLEVYLLKPNSQKVIWHSEIDGADIREWLPGDDWDMQNNHYKIPAKTYTIKSDFTLPKSVKVGEYTLGVAIVDPSNDKPSVHFANENYLQNGSTPLGKIKVEPDLQENVKTIDRHHFNSKQNSITSLHAKTVHKKVALTAHGHFARNKHLSFYIDSDNNPNTGYKRGDIIGADYLIQSSGIYRYPKGAHGWRWTKVSNAKINRPNKNIATTKIPLSLIDSNKIRFTFEVSSHNWKKNTVYPKMISYQIQRGKNISNIQQTKNDRNKIGERKIKPTPLAKGTIFISPNGQGDICTQNQPCNIGTAFKRAKAGDVLFLRGGIYHRDAQLNLSHSGTKNRPIIIESYPNERAHIQGVTQSVDDIINPNDWSAKNRPSGISIQRGQQYIYIRNIEVSNFANSGISISGSHNKIKGCDIHNNIQAGIGINGGNWHTDNGPYSRGYNIISDNIIHDNSDVGMDTGNAHTRNGGNADGIWIGSGIGNKILHNRVYHNSDDGIDTWRSTDSYVAYNISYENGLGNGDGNGFKAGGVLENIRDRFPNIGKGAIMKHNIAYRNKSFGFDYNSGKDDVFEYNTAYKNRRGSFRVGDDSILRYNIADDRPIGKEGEKNSWNMGLEPEFISTDPKSPYFLIPKKINWQSR